MPRIFTQQLVIAAALTAITLGAGQFSHAGGYGGGYQPHCFWKTITVLVPVERTRVETVVRYDCYDQPYEKQILVTETVQVPVTKRVKVCSGY